MRAFSAVVVAVIVLLVLVVVMGQVLQQLNALRAVDDPGVRGGQSVLQKFLQTRAVDGDDVRPLQLLHVLHGQGVVVETAGAAGIQPLHYYAVYPSRDSGGKQVNRVGGAHHGQPGLLPGRGTGGQGQQQGGRQGK